MTQPVPSFESIYDTYKQLVYNVALNYVMNAEDAQDVTQEVFVKIYQRMHTFDQEMASMKTWVYQISINQSLDFLKARKAKKRFGFLTSLFDMEEQIPENKIEHPGIQLEQKESLETLLSIIYKLPESQKTAIILTKMEGRSQKEAAEIMETSPKAIESLVQRAKTTIEKKLKETEGNNQNSRKTNEP